MNYTQQQIETANQFMANLQSFTNKEISIINDGKSCNDANRNAVIVGLIVDEFGDAIFSKIRIKF